ncbi:MAG TPA: hypothetical protein DCP85_05655 [Elusimicrobia bacterium]|nr:hypothetical protein [Elusimicrobiota bacterium]
MVLALAIYRTWRSQRLLRTELPPPLPVSGQISLQIPAAPKVLGGSAIDEPVKPPAAYSNEDLYRDLEKEKARMGIQAVVAPSPLSRRLAAAARAASESGGSAQRLYATPAPVSLSGSTPALLAPARK